MLVADVEMDITNKAAVNSVIREDKSRWRCSLRSMDGGGCCREDNEEMCRKLMLKVLNVPKVCKALDIPMIYISTDYVFGEEDTSVGAG